MTDDLDVIVGDNATIDRPLDAEGLWQINPFNGSVRRTLWFYDVGDVATIPADGTSGADKLFGQANDDILYGQGDDDSMSGGDGQDYVEGNAGDDRMAGDAGSDDMIGGTGRINDDLETGYPGRLDGNDILAGGTQYDVMAGDNALIRRTLVDGQWVSNTFNNGIQHEQIWLLDVDSDFVSVVSGRDMICGDEDDDLLYAQGKDDEMHGGSGHDYLEGNAGDDTMFGNGGQDDMVGGTGRINRDLPTGTPGRLDGSDVMYGEDDASSGSAGGGVVYLPCPGGNVIIQANTGSDILVGDNGIISRPLGQVCRQPGRWQVQPANGAFARTVRLLDVETIAAPPYRVYVRGGDHLWGNNHDDVLFGQGGADELRGGTGDDYIEGNGDDDWIFGDQGEDDLIGGSSAGDGLLGSGVPIDMLADGDDWILGGDEDDVLMGDNGVIARPLDATGAWMHTKVDRLLAVQRTLAWPARDVMSAFGNDQMEGQRGNDILAGNGGDDYMEGNWGRDLLWGDGGNDYLEGNDGNDRLVGNQGDDILAGNDGDDCIQGDSGRDRLYGWDGDDWLWRSGDFVDGGRGRNQGATNQCSPPGILTHR